MNEDLEMSNFLDDVMKKAIEEAIKNEKKLSRLNPLEGPRIFMSPTFAKTIKTLERK